MTRTAERAVAAFSAFGANAHAVPLSLNDAHGLFYASAALLFTIISSLMNTLFPQ